MIAYISYDMAANKLEVVGVNHECRCANMGPRCNSRG